MDLTKQELEVCKDYISNVSGLHFDASNSEPLRDALITRLELTQLKDISQYYEYLKSDHRGPAELKNLLSLITVNETNFFRHPDHFKVFKEYILPELVNRKLETEHPRAPSISIWSAGCSSGDEPYSIAISILETLDFYPLCKVEILGTDIDDIVLSQAQRAAYSKKSVRHIDDACLEKYFKKAESEFILKDEIKNMVNFKHHNLNVLPYPAPASGKWDIIFCRNVIIYFNKKAVRYAISNFFDCLADSGYLFLGYSESLHGISNNYSLVRIGDTFVYKKEKKKKKKKESAKVPRTAQSPIETKKPETEDESLVLYNEAFELFVENKYDEAMTKVSMFLEKSPEDAKGHLLAGRLYLEQGILEQAAGEIKKAIEIEPLLTPAYYFLGITYETQNLTDEAIEQLKKALYLDQDLILARFNLASIYRAAGNIEDALREYNNVIKCLERMPPAEPLEFASAFTVKTLMKTCQKSIQQLQAKEVTKQR